MDKDEKTRLQRRIKNQRAELKRLNVRIKGAALVNRSLSFEIANVRRITYCHAATLVEHFSSTWMTKRKLADYIRRWAR